MSFGGEIDLSSLQTVAAHPLLHRSPRRIPLHHLGHVPARFQSLRQRGRERRRRAPRAAGSVGRGLPALHCATRRVGLDRRGDQELALWTRPGLAQTSRRGESSSLTPFSFFKFPHSINNLMFFVGHLDRIRRLHHGLLLPLQYRQVLQLLLLHAPSTCHFHRNDVYGVVSALQRCTVVPIGPIISSPPNPNLSLCPYPNPRFCKCASSRTGEWKER